MSTYKPKDVFKKLGLGPQRAKQVIKESIKKGVITKSTIIGSGRWTQYDAGQIDKLVASRDGKAPKSTTKKASKGKVIAKFPYKGADLSKGHLIVDIPASDKAIVERFGWKIIGGWG